MLPLHLIHECALYMKYRTFDNFIKLLNDNHDVKRLEHVYYKKLCNKIISQNVSTNITQIVTYDRYSIEMCIYEIDNIINNLILEIYGDMQYDERSGSIQIYPLEICNPKTYSVAHIWANVMSIKLSVHLLSVIYDENYTLDNYILHTSHTFWDKYYLEFDIHPTNKSIKDLLYCRPKSLPKFDFIR